MSAEEECSFPLAPVGRRAQDSDARRNCVLNRCFEALKRADGSQALETAHSHPHMHGCPLSTLCAHLLKLVFGLGT
jgi:hypothetical protein